MINIRIEKLYEDVILPVKQTAGSAGYDVFSYCPEGILLNPGQTVFIPTGLKMEIPGGYDIEIRPRSGLSTKNLLIIPNSPGTIDSDYRGEIKICMLNLSEKSFKFEHGMRIAQMILRTSLSIHWDESSPLSSTDRNTGGFGSTGT